MMVKALWIGIVFVSTLGIGLVGIGLYHLIPARIRERIENMHG